MSKRRRISQVCECADLKLQLDELYLRSTRDLETQMHEINKLQQDLEVMKTNNSMSSQAHVLFVKLKDGIINSLNSQLNSKNSEIEQMKQELQAAQSVKNSTPLRDLRGVFLNKFNDQSHQVASEPVSEIESVAQDPETMDNDYGDLNFNSTLSISRLLVDRRDYAKFVVSFEEIAGSEVLHVVRHLQACLQKAESVVYQSPLTENTSSLKDISVATSTEFTELVEIRIDSELSNALTACDSRLKTLLVNRLAESRVNDLDVIEAFRVLAQVKREPREISSRILKADLPLDKRVQTILANRSQFISCSEIRKEIKSIKGPIEQVVQYFFRGVEANKIPLTEKIKALTECHEGQYYIREDLLPTLKQKLADIRK